MKKTILALLITLLGQFWTSSHLYAVTTKTVKAKENCNVALRMNENRLNEHNDLLINALESRRFNPDMQSYGVYDVPADREFVLEILLSSGGHYITASVKLMQKDLDGKYTEIKYKGDRNGASETHALEAVFEEFPMCKKPL